MKRQGWTTCKRLLVWRIGLAGERTCPTCGAGPAAPVTLGMAGTVRYRPAGRRKRRQRTKAAGSGQSPASTEMVPTKEATC